MANTKLSAKRGLKMDTHIRRLLIIMVCWFIFMGIMKGRKFYSVVNFQTMFAQFPEFGLMSLGVLKPFEMLVRDAKVACIMTSFNKINGIFAGANKDLCTHILREEWGFEGAVVTDWGDMDIVTDGADAVAAGNDIVMPGGPPVIAQILKGVQEKRVTRRELENAVSHLLDMTSKVTP